MIVRNANFCLHLLKTNKPKNNHAYINISTPNYGSFFVNQGIGQLTLKERPHLLDALASLFFVFLVFSPPLDQFSHQLEVPNLLTAVFLISFWLGILTFVGSSGDVVERTKRPGERSPWGNELSLRKNKCIKVVNLTITTWRKKYDCLEVL